MLAGAAGAPFGVLRLRRRWRALRVRARRVASGRGGRASSSGGVGDSALSPTSPAPAAGERTTRLATASVPRPPGPLREGGRQSRLAHRCDARAQATRRWCSSRCCSARPRRATTARRCPSCPTRPPTTSTTCPRARCSAPQRGASPGTPPPTPPPLQQVRAVPPQLTLPAASGASPRPDQTNIAHARQSQAGGLQWPSRRTSWP